VIYKIKQGFRHCEGEVEEAYEAIQISSIKHQKLEYDCSEKWLVGIRTKGKRQGNGGSKGLNALLSKKGI
jgi:hypothetical protein